MPRDSLADSSRTMINLGGVKVLAAHKQKKHIGPIDPHALKIPARRAESLFGEIHPHLYAEPKHRQFMRDQATPDGVELVSIPGWGGGRATLMNGQVVAGIVPDVRGMSEWSVAKLLDVLIGDPPTKREDLKAYAALRDGISNFLQRVYYEFRNLGVSPQGTRNEFLCDECSAG